VAFLHAVATVCSIKANLVSVTLALGESCVTRIIATATANWYTRWMSKRDAFARRAILDLRRNSAVYMSVMSGEHC
jgi:hypothetical protein